MSEILLPVLLGLLVVAVCVSAFFAHREFKQHEEFMKRIGANERH